MKLSTAVFLSFLAFTFVLMAASAKRLKLVDPPIDKSGTKYEWKRRIGNAVYDEEGYIQNGGSSIVYIAHDPNLNAGGIEPSATFYEFSLGHGDIAIRPTSDDIFACFIIDASDVAATRENLVKELNDINGKTVDFASPLDYVATPMDYKDVSAFYKISPLHRNSCSRRRLYRAVKSSGPASIPEGFKGFHFLTLNYRIKIYLER